MANMFDGMLRVCDNTFGEDITIIRDGEQYTARGTYNDNHEVVSIGADGPEVDSTGPYLQCHKDLLPFIPRKGDVVILSGDRRFTVSRQEPDSEYGIDIFLHKAEDDDQDNDDD